jgi:hypothetical protein
MQVVIEIPDAFAELLARKTDDLPRKALEALVVEAHKAGDITTGQVRLILGLNSRYEADGFLKQHGALIDYTPDDLQHDLAAIQEARRG